MTNALRGIQVLDFSMGVAGPKAGMLCAQHGAQVTKIEPPGKGDWGRVLGRAHGDLTLFATAYNRGKSSLAIDLKDKEAQSIVRKKAEQADVIIENFRTGTMKRLGLDYESVHACNPGVIYVSITGFGQNGPLSEMPATDVVMQAFSGFMFLNSDRNGSPQHLQFTIFDMVAGLYAMQAILAAVLERKSTGQGRHIDCSLLQSAAALQTPRLMQYCVEGALESMYVPGGSVATKDGWVALSVMHDHHFASLCTVIGRDDLAVEYNTIAKRLAHKDVLTEILGQEFRKYTADDLHRRLTQAGLNQAKVQDYGQLMAHPQVQATSTITWVKQDGIEQPLPVGTTPGLPPADDSRASQAPHIGEQSISVLDSWGVDREAINALIARGAVAVPKP